MQYIAVRTQVGRYSSKVRMEKKQVVVVFCFYGRTRDEAFIPFHACMLGTTVKN